VSGAVLDAWLVARPSVRVVSASYGKGDRGAATRLHSLIVRARGHCERCGATSQLQAAHIVKRGYAHTRTDTANAWCLCAKCHWAVDGDPAEFRYLVDATCGWDFYEGLRLKARQGVRVKFDWAVERARLQQVWDALEAAA
jgi:hypothetical protein